MYDPPLKSVFCYREIAIMFQLSSEVFLTWISSFKLKDAHFVIKVGIEINILAVAILYVLPRCNLFSIKVYVLPSAPVNPHVKSLNTAQSRKLCTGHLV